MGSVDEHGAPSPSLLACMRAVQALLEVEAEDTNSEAEVAEELEPILNPAAATAAAAAGGTLDDTSPLFVVVFVAL